VAQHLDSALEDTMMPAIPAAVPVAQLFKTRDVVELLELSRRQLQYWAKTGLIEPSARTPGGHHRYSFDDLVALKATKRLIDAGVSVQKIRKSVSALQALLPRVGRPLSELVLVATGDVVLVFREDTAFEAISGQEWVFEVAGFQREVADFRRQGRDQREQRSESIREDRKTVSTAARDAASTEIVSEGVQPTKPGPRAAAPVGNGLSRAG
jgi:DNA-binding transcriptional MerR regulator